MLILGMTSIIRQTAQLPSSEQDERSLLAALERDDTTANRTQHQTWRRCCGYIPPDSLASHPSPEDFR
jgi:hypothetical protein